MSGMLTVAWKEIYDNFRDKRSLFFALVYGPLLMPALMLGSIVVNANKHSYHYDTGKEIHVYGMEKAPNLMGYLKSKNLDAVSIGEDFEEQVRNEKVDLVVEVSDSYGESLLKGKPAKLIIHYLEESQDSKAVYWQIRGELNAYSRIIAGQRIAVRGFDNSLFKPLDIEENDLSEETFGSSMLANMVMFLVIFSTMMGGFYLAIDTTAGERERLSLEPLLSLPLFRAQVAFGKYIAILSFCSISYLLPLVNIAIWAKFLPESFFGDADIPTLVTWIKIAVLTLPVTFLMAGFLMALAAFSQSPKEAQTQMGFAMFFPMAPFFAIMFMNVRSDEITAWIPILSQYLTADKIMMDTGFSIVHMIPGALSTLLLALVFLFLAVGRYCSDKILQ